MDRSSQATLPAVAISMRLGGQCPWRASLGAPFGSTRVSIPNQGPELPASTTGIPGVLSAHHPCPDTSQDTVVVAAAERLEHRLQREARLFGQGEDGPFDVRNLVL